CCPWCYALLPAPRHGATPGLAQRGNQLLLGGYRVAITEGGLRPQLLADTPEGPIYRGPEPDQTWTMGGAQLVYAGSMIVAAFGCAWLWPRWAGAPIVPVTAFLLLAGVTALGVRVVWRGWPPARERLFDHAWQVVAPRLHAKGFSAGDATFLAGLARLASRTGRRDID